MGAGLGLGLRLGGGCSWWCCCSGAVLRYWLRGCRGCFLCCWRGRSFLFSISKDHTALVTVQAANFEQPGVSRHTARPGCPPVADKTAACCELHAVAAGRRGAEREQAVGGDQHGGGVEGGGGGWRQGGRRGTGVETTSACVVFLTVSNELYSGTFTHQQRLARVWSAGDLCTCENGACRAESPQNRVRLHNKRIFDASTRSFHQRAL